MRPSSARLVLVLADRRLGLGQAPQRAVQRAGRHVAEPLGLPEKPHGLGRFALDLIQLPLEFVDLPLQGLVLLAGAGDLLLGLVQAGLGFADVLGGVTPVTLGRLGLLPRPLGRLGLAPGACGLLGLAPVTRGRRPSARAAAPPAAGTAVPPVPTRRQPHR